MSEPTPSSLYSSSPSGPSGPGGPSFERTWRWAYGAGLLLCVAWPLALQLLLGTAIRPGETPPEGVVRQLGYTFTGLVFLGATFVTWRWGKVRRAFPEVPEAGRPRVVLRETLLYAALFELSSFLGLAYFGLGGPPAMRHARGFIALTSILFLAFVPRLGAWREAAGLDRD